MKFALQTIFIVATVILVILLVVWSILWFAGLMTGWMPFWALIGVGGSFSSVFIVTHALRETRK